MTKHDSNDIETGRDRPVIEITPQMVGAVTEFLELHSEASVEFLANGVFQVMLDASSKTN